MQCTLLVPDLLWPRDMSEDATRGLALPALQTALARATLQRHDPISIEGWLCQAFEVERQQDWPVAPLTLALDGGDPGSAYWFRADPIHLQLQRDRVALMASDTLEISKHEAEQIVEALNGQFKSNGLHFEARAPRRWYLRAARQPSLATETLSAAAGHHVRDVLPTGADAPEWRQIFNEIQMVMHALPVNTERVDKGQPAINSVWIWGGGTKTDVPGRPFAAVWSDDALAQALGAHADAHAAPLPRDGAAWLEAARSLGAGKNHLIVIEACSRAAAYGDAAGWRGAMEQVERTWMEPLVGALRKRVIERLVIASPGPDVSFRFELSAGSLYKFWLPARALSAYRA